MNVSLHGIDNLNDYLSVLNKYKNEYLILAAVRDIMYNPGKELLNALKNFGMSNISTGWCGYAFFMEKGKVNIDKNAGGENPLVEYSSVYYGDVQIVSKTLHVGNKARIIFNEIELAANGRGLNIVVIDPKTREVVDSVCFDFFPKTKKSCFHKKEYLKLLVPLRKKNTNANCYNIDEELDKIIKDYCLDEFYPRYSGYCASGKVIHDLANSWHKNDSVACVVIGDNSGKFYLDENWFLESISLYQKNQVDFFRCMRRKDDVLRPDVYDKEAYDVSRLEKIAWDGYAHVYIISNQGENFIGEWFRSHNVKYESLCDILATHGICIDSEFYEFIADKRESRFFKKNSETSPIQWEYYEQSTRFNTYESLVLKDMCARKCFFLALVMKDFLCAKEWLEKIPRENRSYEKYYDAWQRVTKLLEEISIRLNERQQHDILAVWVDHTKYEDLDMMPFVQSLKDKSIWFENIFTLTGYTRETLRGLFTGKKLIDDKTSEISSINLSNSSILRSLEQYGYRVKILASYFREMFPFRYKTRKSIYTFMRTSELLWDGISTFLESDNPGFVLLPIEETHPPHISIGMSDMNINSFFSRIKVAYKDTDRQIKFYTDLLGQNSTALIFSDHGGGWPRQHTFLSIYGKKHAPRKINVLCSSIDFYKIIDNVIKEEEIEERDLARDFCEIQGVPTSSKRMHISGNGVLPQAAPAFWPPFRGYKGVVTNEYIYIHFAGGHEYLSRRDKLQPQPSWYVRPDDICDMELITEMRKKAGIDYGNEPVDYGPTSEFYSVTMKAYKDNYVYNETKITLINNLIDGMPDEAVALYLGNRLSKEVYFALSLKNRKKIACIIDNENDCVCADLNVPIVPLDKVADFGVKNIIVATRNLPVELEKNLVVGGQAIHVFGIYGWLELNGYYTKFNFYDFAIQSMDVALPSKLSILDFLHFAPSECLCGTAVIMIVQEVKSLLTRLHNILKQAVLSIRIYCLDLTGKAADIVKDYQKIDSSIEVVPIDGYSSVPVKVNELISSVNAKYIFFLDENEYVHSGGLSYLNEIAEQTEADVVAANKVITVAKKGTPSLAEFSEGTYELKLETRILPVTYNDRYAEWNETEIPSFAGSRLYRVNFLRKNGIHFPTIKSGWKDIFCLQTIFGAPKYVKAVSPVCISDGVASSQNPAGISAEYAKELIESMFAYQYSVEILIKQWHGFGNSPALCDKFRERAMTIFDQQYFSGIALNDEISKSVSQAVQEKLQKNPSIGMWWIKYLFMRSSFPQNV